MTGTNSLPGAPNNASASSSMSVPAAVPPSNASKQRSTTEAGFDERYYDNGNLNVHASNRFQLANDLEARVERTRGSASPPRSMFDDFNTLAFEVSGEKDLERIVSDRVLKALQVNNEGRLTEWRIRLDKQWVDFPKEVGFNNGLAPPKPDHIEGFLRSSFPPTVNALGGSATLVKNEPHFVVLPHFAIEFKGASGDLRKAEVQAGYDGAAMVYARNRALAYLGQPDPPRFAAVVTAITDGRLWHAFAHYAHKNEATGILESYQYELACGSWTKYSDFKRGYMVFRNLQEYSHEQSTELRDRLQRHYDIHGVVTAPQLATPSGSRPSSRATPSVGSSASDSPTSKRSGSRSAARGKDSAVLPGSMGPPPVPSSRSSSGSASKRNGDMLPATKRTTQGASPSRSNGSGSGLRPSSSASRASAEPRSASRGNSDRQPIARPSSSRSGSSQPELPKASSASGTSGSRRPDNGARPPQARPVDDRESDRYRGYRDPRYDGLQPVPRRRSDSPESRDRERDKAQPRASAREGKKASDGDRYKSDRSAGSSASSNSTRTTSDPLTRRVEPVRQKYEAEKPRKENREVNCPPSDPAYSRRW